MSRYAEIRKGRVIAVFESASRPKYPPSFELVDLTAKGLPDPEEGQSWSSNLFGNVVPVRRTYTRNSVRESLSAESQISFDQICAKIEEPVLRNIIHSIDDQAEGMPTGTTGRDVLRTLIASWRDVTTIKSDNFRFIAALQLLESYGIISSAEVAKLLN